jgi:hypothetical protein
MKSFIELQTALQKHFSETTKIPFVWADNDYKILPKPFGILQLGVSTTFGRDFYNTIYHESNVEVNVKGIREITINAQIFSQSNQIGKRARDYLELARLQLSHPVNREFIKEAGLIYIESHPLNDIELSYLERKETRASIDMVFLITVETQSQYDLDQIHNQSYLSSLSYFEKVEVTDELRSDNSD